MYIVRIIKQSKGRHVEIETHEFWNLDIAEVFAIQMGLNLGLTVDLYNGTTFVRSYSNLKVG